LRTTESISHAGRHQSLNASRWFHKNETLAPGVSRKQKGEQTMKTKQKPAKGKQKLRKRPLKSSRPGADLGQSEAALEKASEEELKHMGDAEAAQAARKQKQGVKTK
jgi:hypothetical protein